MNELAAIKKHLGVCTTDLQLNHYTLIGVSQGATSTEIKQGLKTAIAAWNNSDRTSDPESAQHVAKLIKQAQAILLDEAKKKEYDKSLGVSIVPPTKSYFPESDPFAPFDPSQCLVGARAQPLSLSFGSIEERWDELSRHIQILNEPAQINHSAANVPLLAERGGQPGAAQNASSPKASPESAAARIDRLKRNRKTKQSLYLASFLILAMGFLGFAGFMFVWNRQQVAQQTEANVAEGAKAIGQVKTKEATPKTIGGKNAPKRSTSESTFVLPTLSKEDSTTESGVGISMETQPSVDPMKPEEPSSLDEPMKPVASMEPTPPPTVTPAMVPTTTLKPDLSVNPLPERPMVAMPNGTARGEWVAVMKKAREAVDKADFKTFGEQIELALPLSTSDEMSAKRARLDQLGQLYEIFIKAMHEAKTKMKGAETLSVGKMLVNIVEVKENELIVRIQGKNERYPWDRLPPGIANAMADFALSDSEPTDVAARAVYFSLSPAKNDLSAKKVKEWFEKSVGKEPIRQDLIQALTDTYE